MGIELMTHSLTISFVNGGRGCFFTVGKSNILLVTTPVMPADQKFCFNALAKTAVHLGIPEDEHGRLWNQIKSALRQNAGAGQRKEER